MKKSAIKTRNVAVIGAAGRMGQEISERLARANGLRPALGLVRSGTAANFHKSAEGLHRADFSDIDVILDFSSAEGFPTNLAFAREQKIPLVSGVTGISKDDLKNLQKAGKEIPVLWSANMSMGVAILMEALGVFRGANDFDFQIEEIHHNKKKDRPSGTAKSLQQTLELVVSKKCPEPISIRGGGVFGVHKVMAMSENEVLTFEHQALNRKLFADGAIRAARWIIDRKPGLYEMKDVFRA